MRTAVLLLALTAAASLAQDPTAPTADEERLVRVQERRAALEEELKRLRGEEKSLLGEVEQLEVELRLRTEELREIRLTLRRTQAELDATVESVQQLEARLEAARPALAAHARALYKMGELSYARLLLSVDRPSDFFRGYRFVTTLARRDRERVAAFRSDIAELNEQRAELERRTAESIELRGQLVAARRGLDRQRKRKTELLMSIVERKETHAAYVEELAEAESRLTELLSGLSEGEVTIPVAAFKGSLPWPVKGKVRSGFGRRKHPRFDTYTVHNGIEIASPPDVEVRAVHEGRSCSPSASADTASWWWSTTGASTTRSTPTSPISRSRRGSSSLLATWWGSRAREAWRAPESTSRCATGVAPRTPSTGSDAPDILES